MPRRWRVISGAVVVALAAMTVVLSTDFRSPPRYDGAGYSVLGLSLATGRGYREIDRPDAPRHDHFPPGYPMALAGLWALTGRSVVAAHALSAGCTVAAVWLAWRWFRRVEPAGVAALLGPALAVNWTWAANGGAIQSEPIYLLLSTASLVLGGRTGARAALGLGSLLGASTLTRHVGACLLVAVVIDRASRGRWREAGWIGLAWGVVVSPWVVWLASVRRNTQVGLLDASGLLPRVAGQLLFYARRLPDALSGPFVEVATVFARGRWIGIVATGGAVVGSLILGIGLIRATRDPRRRLAGLVPLVTLPVLFVWPFTEAGRFLIPLVPCLLVGAVEGGSWIWRYLVMRIHDLILLLLGRTPKSSASPLRGRVGWGVHRKRKPRGLVAAALVFVALPYSTYSLLRPAESRRRTHADFDAACSWITREATRPGPVLTRHPGEVFWLTGRLADAPGSDDPGAIAGQIGREGISYLLVDPDRFANAPSTPLARFVAERPETIREVFVGGVRVYEVEGR